MVLLCTLKRWQCAVASAAATIGIVVIYAHAYSLYADVGEMPGLIHENFIRCLFGYLIY